jgi:prephenate dehydrogenase
MKKPRVAIIGYGQFGKFIAKHLRAHASIVPITRTTNYEKIKNCEVIIFCVPFSGLADAVSAAKPYIAADALIMDVTSVKKAPLTLLKQTFPHHNILGTHPIFGPQSGKNGISGLPIVLCNISVPLPTYRKIKKFLSKTLLLRVIEQSPAEHDHEMAHIQGLTHFIGRALLMMDIKKFKTNTTSYAHLIELTNLLKNDSWELFKTIQLHNTEATNVRKTLLKTLKKIDSDLMNTKHHS